MLYGSVDGERGRTIIVKTDGAGRLETVNRMLARNPDGGWVGLEVDAQGLLRTRPYEPYQVVAGNPFAINVGAGAVTMYTVPASTLALVELVIGVESSATTRLDLTLGGRLYSDNWILPPFGPAFSLPPVILQATQTVVAQVIFGVCNIWVNVKEYSTGDEPTGT
jgi:hypothetical protein